MKKPFFSAKNVTSLAILLALVIVLQAFGGSFSIGAVSLNFTLIPIVLGAMLLGPLAGALLGFACGVVVWIQVIMGLVPFYVLIWTETPVVATLTCIVKTTVAGYVAGVLFRWLEGKNRYLAVFVAAAVVPVINTGLFVVGCLFMWDVILSIAGGTNVFTFILVSLVTFNFFAELAVNLLVAPALHTVYRVVEKQFKK
ncbi:MAG: ECF transporter S component [Clostridia bacterium]|nr:ECF transporter S component [Clostridia bacterium]